MSESLTGDLAPLAVSTRPGAVSQNGRGGAHRPQQQATQYSLSLLFVALAVGLAFIVDHVVSTQNLTLIFVLPVMGAAMAFGWGPSLVAVCASVLAYDFFFTQPYFSLRIASPSDMWATVLLLVVAVSVSALAAESRRRMDEARRAAEQAQALQALAHLVIKSAPQAQIVEAAAATLAQIFRAPAVIFMKQAGGLRPVASAGGARIAEAEEDAAKGALETQVSARAETYPYDRSAFDFWPITAAMDGACVIGVDFTRSGRERPAKPERFVEIVGGYLTAITARPAN
jgi:two-component system sensor histidine kinase KdpD